jgi:chromosome partitioning protein
MKATRKGEGEKMVKITVANHKGGVGKTTSTINLGAALAKMGYKVLIIDTDPQGNVGAIFGIRAKENLYHIFVDGIRAEECMVNARPNIDCILSDKKTELAEVYIAGNVGRERTLAERLENVKGYDFILVDSPPSISLLQTNAVVYTEDVICPVSMDSLAVAGAMSVEETFELIQKYKFADPRVIGILPTFVDMRLIATEQILREIQERWGNTSTKILPPIRIDTTLTRANKANRTIFEFDPKAKASEDYYRVALVLAGKEASIPEREKRGAEAEKYA